MSRLSFPSDQQAGVVNLADVLDPMSADHSAALRSLIDTNGPGYTYRIPDGFTVKIPLQLEATAPRLRNHVYIEGEGPGSVISVTGYGPNPGGSYMAIGLTTAQQVEDIDGAGMRNITIQGDGPGATQTWTNRQAAAVRIIGSTLRQDNLIFADVIFKNHDGFSLHADGGNTALHTMIERCQFINNGNGLNFNADFATVRHCYFTNSEGIENSGIANVIDGNVFVNVFADGITVGGNQNVRAYPASRIVNNQIFGVLGGGSYGVGYGIVAATSMPGVVIANNYIERSYNLGISLTHDGTKGPDDHHIVLGNHIVNAQGTGAGAGMQVSTANVQIIGNHIYNRTSLAGDTYPMGTYKMTTGVTIGAGNIHLEGNYIDMSNGGQYPITLSGSPTGIVVGKNTRVPGSGYANWTYSNAGTFADASGLVAGVLSGGNIGAPAFLATYRMFRQVAPGSNRTATLLSAVGRNGLAQIFVNTDPTFTLALTPNGTEQINGVNAAKTLGVNSAVTLTSDGSNWIAQIHYGTFA